MTDPHPPAFDPTWLDARWSLDAIARDPELEREALRRDDPDGPWHLVDVGAGLGANIRHLSPRLEGDQRWWLVEEDAALCARSLPALARWGRDQGWTATLESDALRLRRDGATLHIRAVVASLLAFPASVPWARIDLVTANAVFDLLPRASFDAFARSLAAHRLRLWTTINYEGMRLTPAHPLDAAFIDRYEAHMQRPEPEGRRLGPRCVPEMRQSLEALGYRVETRPSPWRVGPAHTPVADALLDFMASAVPEVLPDAQRADFDRWLAQRRAALARGELEMTIHHQDLLALPA